MDEAYPRMRWARHPARADYDLVTPGGGTTPTDGTDPKLARWLQSRIDEALSEEPAPPRSEGPPAKRAEDEEAPTAPGAPVRRHEPTTRPLAVGDWGGTEDDEEEPETVQGGWVPPEDDLDPETVRLNRMPVAFIGESVMDEHTVQDVRAPAVHWREEAANLRRAKVRDRADELVRRIDPPSQPSVDSAPRSQPPGAPEDAGLNRAMIGLAVLVAVAMVLAAGALLLMP